MSCEIMKVKTHGWFYFVYYIAWSIKSPNPIYIQKVRGKLADFLFSRSPLVSHKPFFSQWWEDRAGVGGPPDFFLASLRDSNPCCWDCMPPDIQPPQHKFYSIPNSQKQLYINDHFVFWWSRWIIYFITFNHYNYCFL